jgi:hypothetical protein
MARFRLGDEVRVAGLPHSQWQNRQGTIVEIFEHGPYEQGQVVQECAIDVGGERRWFMARHLARTVPARFLRFFQSEASVRWHLEPNAVELLNGEREELVGLLCDCLGFARRRAEAEADEFLTELTERIARATDATRPEHIHADFFKRAKAA